MIHSLGLESSTDCGTFNKSGLARIPTRTNKRNGKWLSATHVAIINRLPRLLLVLNSKIDQVTGCDDNHRRFRCLPLLVVLPVRLLWHAYRFCRLVHTDEAKKSESHLQRSPFPPPYPASSEIDRVLLSLVQYHTIAGISKVDLDFHTFTNGKRHVAVFKRDSRFFLRSIVFKQLRGTLVTIVNFIDRTVFMVENEPGVNVRVIDLSERCILKIKNDWLIFWVSCWMRVVA